MKRRQLLGLTASGLVGLAGCMSASGPEMDGTDTQFSHRITDSSCPPPPTTDPQMSVTVSAVDDVRRRVRFTSFQGVRESVPLVPAVEIVEPTVTDAHAAEIRVILANVADAPVWYYTVAPFSNPMPERNFTPGTSAAEVVLVPPDSEAASASPGCWQTTRDQLELNDYYRTSRFEACERKQVTYRLFGLEAEDSNACLPTGTYEFFDTIQAHDEPTVDADGVEWGRYQWRFTLTIDAP